MRHRSKEMANDGRKQSLAGMTDSSRNERTRLAGWSSHTITTAPVTRDLVMIFAAAIAVRFINLLLTGDLADHAMVEDSSIYWNGAQSWLESGFFSKVGDLGYLPETERVPLYHIFLIPFRWGFCDAVLPTLIGQATLDAATCVIIAAIGTSVSRMVGITAGLFAAIWPNLIIHSGLILADSLFLFLFTLTLLFAVRFLRKASLVYAAIAGLICGLAIITRPIALFIPIAMAIAAPFISHGVIGQWRRGIYAAVLLLLFAVVPLTPIIWRNVSEFGTTQLTSQSGTHLLNWVVGYAQWLEAGVPFEAGSRVMGEKLKLRAVRDGITFNELTPFESSKYLQGLAWEEIHKTPISTFAAGWISGAVINLAAPAPIADPRIRKLNKSSFMDSSGSGLFKRARSFLRDNDRRFVLWVAFGTIGSAVSLIFQFLGWVIVLRKFFWPTVFGSLAILYFLLFNGPVGGPKYRLPFEPILIIFQSVALIEIVEWWRNRIAGRRSAKAQGVSNI